MIEYTLIRSRRKTLAIYIKPGGIVEVRAPFQMRGNDIDRVISQKGQWIEEKLAKVSGADKTARLLPQPLYAPGEFHSRVAAIVKAWESRLGVKASYIGIRQMTTRWGSCTAKTGRIRLNSALIYCPEECVEYIIVHELAHLLERNHSPRFWNIVAEALPDYKTRKQQLNELSWLVNAANNQP